MLNSRSDDSGSGRHWPKWFGYLAAVLLETAITGGLLAVHTYLPLGSYPIVYVLPIMAVAYWLGEGPAILAFFVGLFAFDYFFVPPVHTILPHPIGLESWAQFTAFFLCTAVVAVAMALIRRSQRRTQLLAEELGKSNQHTTDILESITDAFFALDDEWRFTYVNAEAERLLRKTRDELMGSIVWDVFPEAIGSRFYEEYHRAINEQVTVGLEEHYPPLETWFAVRAYPSASGLSVYFRDITESKRTEQEIRDREEELAAVYENAPLIMLLVDGERRVRKANRLAEEFARASVSEIAGRRGGEALRCLHALDDPAGCGFGQHCQECTVRNTVLDTLETGRSHHQVEATLPFEIETGSKDVTFLLSASRIAVREQHLVLVTILDITRRKEAEERLRESRQTLEQHLSLLQQALVPPEPAMDDGYAAAAVYLPAFPGQQIGGDFYDVFRTEPGLFGIVIGDVSGKGIEAAALAAGARSTVHSFAYELSSPGAALSHANAVIESEESSGSSNLVTVFLAIVDPASGALAYSRAGHPPPAILRTEGSVDFLQSGDPPTGLLAGHQYGTFEDCLSPGDKLVLYTDGITEARRSGEMFDVEGVRRALVECGGCDPHETAARLLGAAREWAEGGLQDDIAILVIERESPK